jgi:DNA processing protein
MSSRRVWKLEAGEPGFPACLGDLEHIQGLRAVGRLYGVGERARLEQFDHGRAVTIVGSRRASAYGIRMATELGRELALAGATVVSGMARGIDAAAHRGALAGGGLPIAVVANGPDVVYPPMHGGLHEEIAASGVIVSEYGPGTEARKGQFLDRNRIMAALGKVVVIVEAGQPSGSLVTAGNALKLGRTVGAVPGQVGARNAEGANGLLRDGAYPIRHATDVLDDLFGVDRSAADRFGATLEPHLAQALELVERGAATVDELALSGELDPREAAVSLAHLELLGYVIASAQGEFARTTLAVPPRECTQLD